MSELKYDPEFPYAVVSLGEVKAYSRYKEEARVFAGHYHEGKVIDTTPNRRENAIKELEREIPDAYYDDAMGQEVIILSRSTAELSLSVLKESE